MMNFVDKLSASVQKNNSLLCVGLDPDPQLFPASIGDKAEHILSFNRAIIDATADLVCCYKPNTAFYESFGTKGIQMLHETILYVQKMYAHLPIILDAKRGDIGNTNAHYAKFAFEYLGADAVTIQPYPGVEAAEPFFADPEKAVFVLAKTSNPDSAEFQNIVVDGTTVYERVIARFMQRYRDNGNCFFVAGATYPTEMKAIRQMVGEAPLLVPGVGAQGASIADMVPAGINRDGAGLIINSSRAVLYASSGNDFAEAARAEALRTRDEINKYR